MISTNKYAIIREITASRVRSHEAVFCPICAFLCSGYDTRIRYVIGDDGVVEVYLLQRVKCKSCKAYHVVLPDFIQPYKHYSKTVIRNVLAGGGVDCPAENSTIWRWKKYPPSLQ